MNPVIHYTPLTLRCASMRNGPCDVAEISMIDRKGYVYCTSCGERRRATGTACRALRSGELDKLRRGETIRYR